MKGLTLDELTQHKDRFTDFIIQLWDHDAVGDHDFMGKITIPLSRILEHKDGLEESQKLIPSEKFLDKAKGSLKYKFRFVPS